MTIELDTARRLLGALTADRPTNRSTLCRRLGVDDEALDETLTELAECGLLECQGKRVKSTVLPGTSIEAALVFAALPADGSTMGVRNPRPESEAMVGSRLPAQALLDDLRTSQGVEPALGLPPGPNSGITVRRV